jgi:hypothetical protein
MKARCIKCIFTSIFLELLLPLCNAQTVIVSVDANSGRIPISPYIYGRNNSLSASSQQPLTIAQWQFFRDAGLRLTREGGGNNSTKYNWRTKLTSAPDWYNNVYSADWDFSAQSLQQNLPGVQGFYSLQLIGKAASTNAANFNDWAYNKSTYWSGVGQNLAGGGTVNPAGGSKALVDGNPSLYLTVWPADSTTGIIDHWFGSKGLGLNTSNFMYWNMDNEPDCWNSTHDDIISTTLTAENYMQKYFAVAKAARARYPYIKLVGPASAAEWQWYAWNNASIPYNGKSYSMQEYFIKRIAEEQAATGIRLLDVLDIHFYVSADNITDMLELHRVLFDRNYIYPKANGVHLLGTNGWDPTINKEYIFGRVNDWLVQYLGTNHGVGLSLSEGQLGDDSNHNVSMCLYANMLGTLADNGVEIFAPWFWYTGMWETMHLFSRYAKTIRIASKVLPDNYVSAYSSINTSNDSLTVILVNRNTTGTLNSTVNLTNYNLPDGGYTKLTLSNLPENETFVSHSVNALQKGTIQMTNNSFSVNLAPLSVNAILLTGTNILGLTKISSDNGLPFKIFPNPVKNSLQLEYKIDRDEKISFKILDISGKQLKEILNSHQSAGNYTLPFDSTILKNGSYLMCMTTGGISKSLPFVVAH